MTPRLFLPLAACVALAACTTPAQRITSKLTELGVPPGQARCMGDRLGQRLTGDQLRRLQQLSGLASDRLQRMTIRDIVGQLNAAGDPALVAELLRAGIGCAI